MSLSVPRTPPSQLCFYIPPAQHILRLCRLRAKESVVEGRGGWMHCAPSEVPVNSLQLCSDPPQSVELALVLSRQVKTRGRSEGNELRGRVIIHTPFFLHVADRWWELLQQNCENFARQLFCCMNTDAIGNLPHILLYFAKKNTI